MLQNMAVLGGDRRQFYLAQKLIASGFQVTTYGVPQLGDSEPGLHQSLRDAQAVVLPMPALTKEGWIRAPRPIPLISVLESLKPGTWLFGGVLDSARETLSAYSLRVWDYAADPALAAANAVPTAEGAIALAMEALPITLAASRCLVIGFGRIGKVLADRLRGLRAAVTVTARKPEDEALASALGFAVDRTGLYLRGLRQYDCVFNTVPGPVLKKEHLAALSPDARIIDLATGGGLEPGLELPPQLRYRLCPGLPGQAAPETAAEAIRMSILRTLSQRQEV